MKIIGNKAGFIKRWREKIEELNQLREKSPKDSVRYIELTAKIVQLNACINDLEIFEEKQ